MSVEELRAPDSEDEKQKSCGAKNPDQTRRLPDDRSWIWHCREFRRLRRLWRKGRAREDGLDKAIAVPMKCNDMFTAGCRLVQRAAKDGDVLCKIGFFDDLIGPDQIAELVLTQYTVMMPHKRQQRLKDLGCEHDGDAIAMERSPLIVQDIIAEPKDHPVSRLATPVFGGVSSSYCCNNCRSMNRFDGEKGDF